MKDQTVSSPIRRDARDKATGRAVYAADRPDDDMLHLALVLSPAMATRVRSIDASAALVDARVVGVMTHESAPRFAAPGQQRLLQDDAVLHAGQPVAVVAATSRAAARRAAALVRLELEPTTTRTSVDGLDIARAIVPDDILGQPPSYVRGTPLEALQCVDGVRVSATYTTPTHVHSPLEPHVVTAEWSDDSVLVQTSTSGIFAARDVIASAFGVSASSVIVHSPLQGGGFCAKGSAWWPCLLVAVAAARHFGRAVHLELTREQMFTAVGNRQQTIQSVDVAAQLDGRLIALSHDIHSETGRIRNYSESTGFPSRSAYRCDHVRVRHRVVVTDTPQPLPMRGPGEAPGSFALECALDELAERLGLDPVTLRLMNIADRDAYSGRPWSTNSLAECLHLGARAFGWDNARRIGTRRNGRRRRGVGMASSYYPGFRAPASATVRLFSNGIVEVDCGTQEIGTGITTVIVQAAAQRLRVPLSAIALRHGESTLPESPMAAGAMSTASIVPAVEAAADDLNARLAGLAVSDPLSPLVEASSPAASLAPDLTLVGDERGHEWMAAVLQRAGVTSVEGHGRSHAADAGATHSVMTFGACFAEVEVDDDLRQVSVTRLLGAYAAGRIMNERLARSQLIGGIVFGIGMALHEHLQFDRTSGLPVNRSFTDYLLPTNADVPDVQVMLIEEHDDHVPSGVKGLGMSGTVGTAAAIANAVYHATGVRFRHLPITPAILARGLVSGGLSGRRRCNQGSDTE